MIKVNLIRLKKYLIKKNSLVIIYNHGSIQDHKQDPCKAKPKFGYILGCCKELKLHNKKINGLRLKFIEYAQKKVCQKIKKNLKSKGKINLVDEHKNIKRQKYNSK